jgi:HSP90 family molecular chaperone
MNNSLFDTKDVYIRELLSALDSRVKEALQYYERRVRDRQYALAADVPMQ